jgi:hypothetical protein
MGNTTAVQFPERARGSAAFFSNVKVDESKLDAMVDIIVVAAAFE